MKKTLLLLLLSGSLFSLKAQQGTQAITVTDMTRIKQINSVTFSHSGKQIAFRVTSIVPDETNKAEYAYRNQIWLVPADGSAPARPLTTVALSSGQPAWSPDDSELAFTRVVKGKTQVFIMALNGGEPIQLTNDSHGASMPQWSPDGSKILYSVNLSYPEMLKDSILNPERKAPYWTVEKPGFKTNLPPSKTKKNANGNLDEIRAFLTQDEADSKVKVFNKLNFEGEASTEPDFNFNHYMVIDAKAGAKEKPLTFGFHSYNGATFTPDGKSIILTGMADTTLNPDRSRTSTVYTMPASGGSLKQLINMPDMAVSNSSISPSGRYVVYQFDTEKQISIPQVAIYDFQNPGKKLLIPVDRIVTGFAWSKDSKFLYFTAQSNGGIPIYKVNMATLKPEQLSSFDEGLSGLDISKTQMAYVKTEVANPFELYVADLNNKAPKRITSFNYEWLKDKKLSFPEKKYYTNSKGLKVEYWVMKPTNFDQNKKYPLMLQIHGGPTAMWGPGESSMWHEYQFFCAQGYGVVYSNPRGSGGYGLDYTKANYQDWGTGPTEDVLAALDGALAEGWGDKDRTVATGGSYAGYLTAWLAGHTKRFAAISSQRGVYDLTTFFGEGNAWRLVPTYFGGYPWDENIKPILARESPFTYVNQITTPYLMLHGETDLRTGIVQGEMMYKALKVLNRPVEYVQHPGGTHELSRSGNVRQRIDQMLRIYEFFERYITH
ncbi:S9 family peptidase [Mucilaginibacter agri]|uniref:Prolyl oligopeptidase family serine peptidase n=1 Tax=Mucilaginibacter agri TaxID=2695265 RepID=A0A965ZFH6_9SPHI|nr:S9 family peptidase [Mucilaginibacter agri]NCD68706.1 prolyl oligopeptidase family serine peptidase [Mucilaginibacter agri]